MQKTFWYGLLGAAACGLIIGYVDTRPTWDDTGITVGATLLFSALLGAMIPRTAWLWGVIVGGTVLVWNLLTSGGYGAAVALPIAVAGALAGAGVRKLFSTSHSTRES